MRGDCGCWKPLFVRFGPPGSGRELVYGDPPPGRSDRSPPRAPPRRSPPGGGDVGPAPDGLNGGPPGAPNELIGCGGPGKLGIGEMVAGRCALEAVGSYVEAERRMSDGGGEVTRCVEADDGGAEPRNMASMSNAGTSGFGGLLDGAGAGAGGGGVAVEADRPVDLAIDTAGAPATVDGAPFETVALFVDVGSTAIEPKLVGLGAMALADVGAGDDAPPLARGSAPIILPNSILGLPDAAA